MFFGHISLSTSPGPPREILQGGTRLLWGPGDRLRLPSKLRIWGSIKPLVNFHKCFISCAAELGLYKKLIYYLNSSRPDFRDYKITSTSNTLLHQLIMFVTASPSWLSRLRTDVPAKPSPPRPWTSPLFALSTCCDEHTYTTKQFKSAKSTTYQALQN
jgi:hypothetical protein